MDKDSGKCRSVLMGQEDMVAFLSRSWKLLSDHKYPFDWDEQISD